MSEKQTEKDIAALKNLVPLHTLTDARFEELLAQVRLHPVTRGSVIFREGDADHEHIYLLEGTLALMSGNKATDKIAAGSDTARFPVAHQLPRRYGARAVTAARLAHIDSRFVSDLLARNQRQDYQVNELEEDGQHGDWMAQLLQSRIMQQIPAANIQGVMMRVEHLEVEPGDVLITQGEEGDAYYMLSQGRALVTRDMHDGDPPHELAQLGPGAAFGEEALLSDSPRNSTITMLSKGVVLRLSKDDFLELIQRPLSRSYGFDEAQRLVAEQGAVWLDVRPQQAYEQGNLPGSINLPFDALRYQAASLGRDRQYIVCSGSGERAIAAAFLLTEQGFEVGVLKGGYDALAASDDPESVLVSDTHDEPTSIDAASTLADDTERERLRAQVEAAEQRAREMEERLQALAAEKEQADERRQSQFQALKDSIDNAKAKILQSEQERRELREIVSKTKGKDDKWQQKLKRMERELIAERERAESAGDSLQEIAQKLTVVMEERELERAKHDQKTGELKEQLTAVQLELEDTTQELAALRKTVADTQALVEARVDPAELDAIRATEADVRAELAAAKQALAEAQAAGQSGDQAVAELQKQLAEQQQAAEAERARLDTAVQTANSALDEANQARESAESRLAELEQASGTASADHEQALAALRDELTQARDSAQRDAAAAGRSLQDAQAEIATLTDARQQAGSELDALKQALGDQEKAAAAGHADLTATIDSLQAQLKQLTDERDALQGERDAISGQAGDADQALAAVQGQLTEQQQAAADRQAEAEKAVAELQAQVEQLGRERDALQAEQAALNDRAGDADQLVTELRRQLADQQQAAATEQQTLRAKLDEHAAQASAAEAARADGQQRVDQLQSERDQLAEQLANAQKQLAEQTGASTTADNRVTELEGELERAWAKLNELTAERDSGLQGASEAKDRIQSLTDDLAQARSSQDAQLVKLGEERDQAVAELQTAQAQAEARQTALQARIDALQSDLEDARAAQDQASTLREERDALTTALESAQTQLANDAEAAAKQLAQRDDTIAELAAKQAELETALSQAGDADQSLAELREAQRAAEQQLAEQAADIARLETELAAATQTREQAEQQAAQQSEQAGVALADLAERDDRIEALTAQLAELEAQQAGHDVLQGELDDAHAAMEALEIAKSELVEQNSALEAAQRDQAAESEAAEQLKVQLRATEQARDAAQAEAQARSADVQKLRAVMEEHVEQIQAAQQAGDGEDVAALRMELELVRQQAAEDAERLRQSAGNGGDALEREALRQELATIKQTLSERQRELTEAAADRLNLEESLEDANRQVDELRRIMDRAKEEAEEAEFQREESDQARHQLEQTLRKYQEDAVEADALDLRDERLKPTRGALDMTGVLGGLSKGSLLLGLLIGIGLLVGGLELVLWLTGRGELFALLFGGG